MYVRLDTNGGTVKYLTSCDVSFLQHLKGVLALRKCFVLDVILSRYSCKCVLRCVALQALLHFHLFVCFLFPFKILRTFSFGDFNLFFFHVSSAKMPPYQLF